MKKNKFRIIYSLVLFAITSLLAFTSYHLGNVSDIKRKASLLLDKEIVVINSKHRNLLSEKEQIQKQKSSLAKQVNENSDISKEIELTVKKTEQTKKDIEAKKAETAKLDEDILQKKSELEKLNSISKATHGKKLSLGNGIYSCPANLSKGRYTVSGNSTLLVYNKSNSLIISEDLSRLPSNSFTFDLEDGMRIKITSGEEN